MPGSPVGLKIQAERGSCVCVASVDKSMYLLKPGFQLTPEKVNPYYRISLYTFLNDNLEVRLLNFYCMNLQVFKELLDFDVSDAFGVSKDDGHFWWPGLSSRRRRSSVFPWHWDITKDARFAFTVRVLLFSHIGGICDPIALVNEFSPKF